MHVGTMDDRDVDVTLEISVMAASAFRTHSWIMTGAEADFERLGLDAMEQWFRYANDFSANYMSFEGLRAEEIAKRFYERYNPGAWDKLPPRGRLAFEAVIRHLSVMADAPDEARDLASLEQFWRGWTEERLRTLAPVMPPAPLPPPPPPEVIAKEWPPAPPVPLPPPPPPVPMAKECRLCGKPSHVSFCSRICRKRYRQGHRRPKRS